MLMTTSESSLVVLDLPEVERVVDEHGDHVEPPVESSWSEAETIAWFTACASLDTGISIRVYMDRERGGFGFTQRGSSTSCMEYDRANAWLWGFTSGAARGDDS